MPLTNFNLPPFSNGAVSSLVSRGGGVKWLAAVAAVAALALLGAGLLVMLAVGDTEAQTLPPTDGDGLFSSLSLARPITCGVTLANNIRCWGNVTVGPLYAEGYEQVAATRDFTCGLRSNGIVHCWYFREDYLPNLPVKDDGDPDTEDPPITFSVIVSSELKVCGIQDDQNGQESGLVRCWERPARSAYDNHTPPADPDNPGGPNDLAATPFSEISLGMGPAACGGTGMPPAPWPAGELCLSKIL